MSEEQTIDVLTIDNGKGDVYAIPLDVLEAFKVPEEDAKELSSAEELSEDDVSGYILPSFGRPAPRPYRPPVSYRPQQSFNPGSFWGGGGGRVIAPGALN